MQSQDIVNELRGKKSRDNRDLLDRAADEIERLRATKSSNWQVPTPDEQGNRSGFECRNCGFVVPIPTHYCCWCGAQMDKELDEEGDD